MLRYSHLTSVRLDPLTVECDEETDLLIAILEQDRFQDGWWQCSLRDSAQIIADGGR